MKLRWAAKFQLPTLALREGWMSNSHAWRSKDIISVADVMTRFNRSRVLRIKSSYNKSWQNMEGMCRQHYNLFTRRTELSICLNSTTEVTSSKTFVIKLTNPSRKCWYSKKFSVKIRGIRDNVKSREPNEYKCWKILWKDKRDSKQYILEWTNGPYRYCAWSTEGKFNQHVEVITGNASTVNNVSNCSTILLSANIFHLLSTLSIIFPHSSI